MSNPSKYDRRGVSATKDEVHEAIKNLDKGLFPNAFCKILPDYVAADPEFCNIMHADTAGTKTSLAYMYWKETGDLSVWEGIAQDSMVMNLDDMACVGCYENIVLSSTIGRNKNLIDGAVIKTIIQYTQTFVEKMADLGVGIFLAGGETADVGDIVRTIDVGYTTFGRIKRSDVLEINVKPGDVIVGFASDGQASYEDAENSGMGSNGLTMARHDALSNIYAEKYPDSFDSNTPSDVIYTGSKKLTDPFELNGTSTTIGKLILSPTRTYLPLIKALFENERAALSGLIHCTGGGQTKVEKFIGNVRVVKDQLFKTPPLFQMIQEESGTDWQEMYRVFNMGHRLEAYCKPERAEQIMALAHSFNIKAKIIGHVEASDKREIKIVSPYGTFTY
ncbi:MAG: AIR synthase-related protein [Bacteroidota bacterium]